MADEPVTRFHLQKARHARRPGRARHDRQRRGLAEAEHVRPRPRSQSLADAPRAGCATRDWRGLVLTGKPLVFAAGADLTQFPGDHAGARARRAARRATSCSAALRELPFPTLAAINGAALGGGLEIALHCDFRTLASIVRHLGFPEVFLGLFPAWGGTQLDAAARRRRGRRRADRRRTRSGRTG